MNEDVYKTLTEKDKALLSALYESETMKAIKNSLATYQLKKAEWVILQAPDHLYTVLNRGNVEGARFIVDLALYANKIEQRKRS